AGGDPPAPEAPGPELDGDRVRAQPRAGLGAVAGGRALLRGQARRTARGVVDRRHRRRHARRGPRRAGGLMRRRKSGMRKAVLLLFLVSGLGVAGIALMAAYDDAHTAAGANVAGGPAHNPMPPRTCSCTSSRPPPPTTSPSACSSPSAPRRAATPRAR